MTAEKRKPICIFMVKNTTIDQKNFKIEVFKSTLWNDVDVSEKRYRLRVDGAWFPKGAMCFFYKSEIRELMFKSIKFD